MSAPFHEILDATIENLQALKARGTQFVPVTQETLRALNSAAPNGSRVETVARAAAPAPASLATTNHEPRTTNPVPPLNPSASARSSGATAPKSDEGGQPSTLNPSKSAALAQLRERALQCVKCPNLVASRTQVVFGVGNIEAELMFVGEAPGADEDAQGEPFVGLAGQLLTKMIQAMGLTRDRVYIANILKCRPDMPANSTGNRKPTPEEMQTCIPYLHAQIDLIQPKVLVALGGTAMEGLLNKSGIMKLRGHWHTYRGTPLMPTYHPAYLLRNQSFAEKRKVWEDLLAVMEKLALPISEKQRGYFLRA